MRLASLRRSFVPACVLLGGCVQAAYDEAKALSVTEASSPDPTTSSGGTGSFEPESPTGAIHTVTGDEDTSTSAASSTGVASSTGEAIPPPMLLAVDLPPKVTAAGPVHVTVHAAHSATVRGVLDGLTQHEFADEGDEDGDGVFVFTTILPIFGTVDNGPHTLEVVAERDGLQDHASRPFSVDTPATGKLAWERFGGPGTRLAALAVSPAGDVFEGGALLLGETERPSVRSRDPLTGNDLWPGGAITVDLREGAVADLAFTAEGNLWVAMNVREADIWRARIVLLGPDMQPTGIELPEKPYANVTAIDDDGDGGCVAVGFATTLQGDTDILLWRMTGDGVPILSGQPWDLLPDGSDEPHSFSDFAFDVVTDPATDEAWIVGGSHGPHVLAMKHVRGIVLHVDLDTLELLGPPFVAPPSGDMIQSIFNGAALDPAGILVTGYECDTTCGTQQLLARRYDAGGQASWSHIGKPFSVAFGAGIARTTYGTILIAANNKEATTMRGSLLGHDEVDKLFEPLPFPGKGTSTAKSVVVGPYDWTFAGGTATVAGAPQSYVMRVHQ